MSCCQLAGVKSSRFAIGAPEGVVHVRRRESLQVRRCAGADARALSPRIEDVMHFVAHGTLRTTLADPGAAREGSPRGHVGEEAVAGHDPDRAPVLK